MEVSRQVEITGDLRWNARLKDRVLSQKEFYGMPSMITNTSQLKALLLQVNIANSSPFRMTRKEGQKDSTDVIELKKQLKRCKERERYWKANSDFERKTLTLVNQDNDDLQKMFEYASANGGKEFDANPEMKLLWETQRKALASQADKKNFRWHPNIIKLCLQIWHRSKSAYECLQASGFLRLPSGRLLRYYKNSVNSSPGLQKDRLAWMKQEAAKDDISPFGHHGAIMFDEMSIQADIQMKQRNGQWEIVGVARMGESAYHIEQMTAGEEDIELATHVLQFLFLGNTGFRFPVCHFPTSEASSIQLFEAFWDCVDTLAMYGFTVRLCICDGAGVNRKFVGMHFSSEDDAEKVKFTTTSPCSGKSLTFIMDPSHNFKKIRNSVEKSRKDGKGVKHLALGEEEILWEHLRNAYEYDISHNSLQTHRYLTEEHFELTSANKMRNHLADDV